MPEVFAKNMSDKGSGSESGGEPLVEGKSVGSGNKGDSAAVPQNSGGSAGKTKGRRTRVPRKKVRDDAGEGAGRAKRFLQAHDIDDELLGHADVMASQDGARMLDRQIQLLNRGSLEHDDDDDDDDDDDENAWDSDSPGDVGDGEVANQPSAATMSPQSPFRNPQHNGSVPLSHGAEDIRWLLARMREERERRGSDIAAEEDRLGVTKSDKGVQPRRLPSRAAERVAKKGRRRGGSAPSATKMEDGVSDVGGWRCVDTWFEFAGTT